jgi:hypothetical protein
MHESVAKEEMKAMRVDTNMRFRVVEIQTTLKTRRVLAVANDLNEAERLCDLHFGELTVRQIQDGYTVRVEPLQA